MRTVHQNKCLQCLLLPSPESSIVKADFHLSFRLPPRQDFRVEESSTLSAKPFSAAGDCATLRHQRKSCRGGRRKLKWKSALSDVSLSNSSSSL